MFDSALAWDWANRFLALFSGFNSLVVGLVVVAFIMGILLSMAMRAK